MKTFIFLLLIGLLVGRVEAADDKTTLCILCHGTNVGGNAAVRAPKLAGLDRDYLKRQLEAFRIGIRGTHAQDVSGSEMRIIALSLTETEIVRVLDFVAMQKSEGPAESVSGNIDRGKTHYATCVACHGLRGEGNSTLKAPALSKGSDWYWVIQLSNYRNGLRGAHSEDTAGQLMRTAAQSLPDEQAVRDVVAYINTLQ